MRTQHTQRRAATALASLLLATGALAQDPVETAIDKGSALTASHGLVEDDHGLRGGGTDYRVHFQAGSVEFTPALGREAERTMPLALSLSGIERDGRSVAQTTPDARPRRDGDRVTYLHADGVEERYEVAPEGVYQSFWFPRPLEGSGDLVVRLDVETELAALQATRVGEGARYELSGIGAVTIGTVTGIDADGNRVAGDVRLVGDELELSLPASFVDAAAYPLLLDPLIGTDITISTGTWQDGGADVAYDGDHAEYLVVWSRVFSFVDAEIRAQRVSSAGATLGGTLFLTGGSDILNLSPSVGSVDLRDHFVVAWEQFPVLIGGPTQIKALNVEAGTPFASQVITVSSSTNFQTTPRVCGDRGVSDDDVIVVWDEENVGIRARQVTVVANGDIGVAGNAVTIAADDPLATYSEPAVSKSTGDTGILLVSWTARSLFTGRTSIEARAYDRDLAPVSLPSTISSAAVTNDSHSAVDGDGEHWVVAFQREETVGSGRHDIYATAVTIGAFDVLRSDVGEVVIEDIQGQDETDAAVSFVGKHTLIAYERPWNVPADAVFLESVDPFTALRSGEVLRALATAGESRNAAIASQYSGGGSQTTNEAFDDALVAVEFEASGESDFDIWGVRYDAGSEVDDLGGGCGAGGELFTPCTFRGNHNFRVRLEGAPANRMTFLSVSTGSGVLGCGPCILVTAFDGSNVSIMAMTDADGVASFPAPIPPGAAGARVYAQAVTFQGGGPCPLFTQVRLSDGVAFDID